MSIKVSDFLSTFFPDPDEAIHLRALKAKGAIESGENKPVMIQTTRRELADNAETQRYIRKLNKTRGLYFIRPSQRRPPPSGGGGICAAEGPSMGLRRDSTVRPQPSGAGAQFG